MEFDPAPATCLAADACIKALLKARDALDEHYRACDNIFDGQYNDLGIEARKRLNQIVWLLSEIKKQHEIGFAAQRPQFELGAMLHSKEITAEEWADRISSFGKTDTVRLILETEQSLETLTEAFYWIAFRARNAIRTLPKLGNFEAQGVRDTRNKLLEHPDKPDSGILISSFGWGNECGPVIKALRYGHQSDAWVDRGLFVNAHEFAVTLQRKAQRSAKELLA